MSRAEVEFEAYPSKKVHSFVALEGPRARPVYLSIKDPDNELQGRSVALTPEEVYMLVDLWTANVERPEPPKDPSAWDHFLELPEGAQFTWQGFGTVYTKDGDLIRWEDWDGEARADRASLWKGSWSEMPYDFVQEYSRSHREVFDSLPVPSTFWLKIAGDWYERIKVSDSRYYSSELSDITLSADYLDYNDYEGISTENPNA